MVESVENHQGFIFSKCLTGEEISASETTQMAMLEGNLVLHLCPW